MNMNELLRSRLHGTPHSPNQRLHVSQRTLKISFNLSYFVSVFGTFQSISVDADQHLELGHLFLQVRILLQAIAQERPGFVWIPKQIFFGLSVFSVEVLGRNDFGTNRNQQQQIPPLNDSVHQLDGADVITNIILFRKI